MKIELKGVVEKLAGKFVWKAKVEKLFEQIVLKHLLEKLVGKSRGINWVTKFNEKKAKTNYGKLVGEIR